MFLSYPSHKVLETDMNFDLLTWIPIGIIYSSRTIYLPSLKLLGKAFSSYQLHKVWETDVNFDLWPTDLNINRDHLLMKYYPLTKFEASGISILELSVAQGEVDWHDLDLWPADLDIIRCHLLIRDYLPTKFEASVAKRSWVISCIRCSRLAWPLTFDLLTWISIGSSTHKGLSTGFWAKAFLSY